MTPTRCSPIFASTYNMIVNLSPVLGTHGTPTTGINFHTKIKATFVAIKMHEPNAQYCQCLSSERKKYFSLCAVFDETVTARTAIFRPKYASQMLLIGYHFLR